MLRKYKKEKSNAVKQSSFSFESVLLMKSVIIKIESGDVKIGFHDGRIIQIKKPSLVFLAKNQTVDIMLSTVDGILAYDCIEIESSTIKSIYNNLLLHDEGASTSSKSITDNYLVTPAGTGMSEVFDLLHFVSGMKIFPKDKKEHLVRFLLSDFSNDRNALDLFKAASGNTLSEDVHCLLLNKINQKFTLEDISKLLYMSPSTLKRKLSQENTSFSRIRLNARMSRARELLRGNALSITEISHACGYDSTSYFTLTFKKYFNKTPTEFVSFISGSKVKSR